MFALMMVRFWGLACFKNRPAAERRRPDDMSHSPCYHLVRREANLSKFILTLGHQRVPEAIGNCGESGLETLRWKQLSPERGQEKTSTKTPTSIWSRAAIYGWECSPGVKKHSSTFHFFTSHAHHHHDHRHSTACIKAKASS